MKIIFSTLISFSLLLFTGCGPNNKDAQKTEVAPIKNKHPQCAGSYEEEKCEKSYSELDKETPEEKLARQERSESERSEKLRLANAEIAVEAPNTNNFDSTGIIDTQSIAATLSSCKVVGDKLELATNRLWNDLNQKEVGKIKTQDDMWQLQKRLKAITDIGESGSRFSSRLDRSMSELVPPSEMRNIGTYYTAATRRFDSIALFGDPNLAIQAFSYCRSKF